MKSDKQRCAELKAKKQAKREAALQRVKQNALAGGVADVLAVSNRSGSLTA